MGVLARFLAILGLGLVLALPAPVQADMSDKDAAAALMRLVADTARQERDSLTAALGDDDKFVFWGSDEPLVITKQQVDNAVAYLQLQYMLYPDKVQETTGKLGKLFGIAPGLYMPLLADPESLAADGVEFTLYALLRSKATEMKPKVEAYIAKLDALIADATKEAETIETSSTWPPGASVTTKTFSPVQNGGMTVDYCLSFGASCGQPVADEFCRRQGFKGAQSFEWQYMHPTRTLGSGELCDAAYCGGITSVTCQ